MFTTSYDFNRSLSDSKLQQFYHEVAQDRLVRQFLKTSSKTTFRQRFGRQLISLGQKLTHYESEVAIG